MKSIYRAVTILFLAAASQAASPLYIVATPLTPIVYPGTPLQIAVTITSTQPLQDIHVELDSPFPVATSGDIVIPALAPNTPVTLTYLVQVPLTAQNGIYTLKFTAYTLYVSASYSLDITVRSFNLSALIYPRGFPTAPGESAQLAVLLFNPTLDFVKVHLYLQGYPVKPFLNWTADCETFIPPRGNATCIIPYTVDGSAKEGVYYVTLTAHLEGVSGLAGSIWVNRSVPLVVSGTAAVNVMLAPAQQIVVGKPSLVNLVLSTGSNAQVYNVTVTPLRGRGLVLLVNQTFRLPLLTQAQIPLQAVVWNYGLVGLDVKICLMSGVCKVDTAWLYVPRPNFTVNVAFNPPQASPGAYVVMTSVINTDAPVSDLNFSVSSPFVIESGGSYNLSALMPGMPVTLTTAFWIPPDLSPGVYPVRVKLGDVVRTFYYRIDEPQLGVAVYFNPPVAYPGSVVTATFTIQSPYSLKYVDAKLHTPLKLLSNASLYLPLIPQGQPVTLTALVQVPENAEPRRYPLVLSIGGRNYTAYLNVEMGRPVIQNVAVYPPRVLPGVPAVQVVVQVINTGVVAARNITVSIENATVGPSTYYIDLLPPGSPVQLSFTLDISKLNGGRYNVPVHLYANGVVQTAVGTLEVREKDRIEVRYKVLGATPGGIALLLVNITNRGLDEAKNLRVIFTPSQVFELHTSNLAEAVSAGTRQVGDLKPGDTAEVEFLLDVSDKAPPGVYPVRLVVMWNQTGVFTPGVEYIEAQIAVTGGLDLFVVVPAVLAVVILALGVVTFLRRRRGVRH